MKEKTKRLSRQEELFFALGISQQELELNRKGILSKQQGESVWRNNYFRQRLIFAVCSGAVSLFLLVIMIVYIFGVTSHFGLWCLILFHLLIALLCLIPVKQVIGIYKAIRSDLKAKKLKQIEGLAIVDLGGERRAASFSINGHYLRVNHATLLRIKHLEPHRVYYLPHTKVAVAVEVMER